jgi:vacuolar protein sorting-associated protein 45
MVGGATYEEARHIAQINASTAGIRVVYGGTTVHNSVRYVQLSYFTNYLSNFY